MNIINKARKFAERAHKPQKRRYTGEPYFVHLDEVAKLCKRFGLSKVVQAAAYLHDTIEDQPVTYEDLVNEFGYEVASIVRELTDVPPELGNRPTRRKLDLARIEKASPEAQSIKCADLISNTSSIAKHDPNFARTYLPEKRATLTVLRRANQVILAYAWSKLLEAEKEIERE
jgi:(p)ppGpp synthase/HD superfamily hydrolase